MRAVEINTKSPSGQRHREPGPGSVPRGEQRAGARRTRDAARPKAGGLRLPGLRWVPVPLALLAVALGWLMLGTLQGQAAANAPHVDGYQAAGLGLVIDGMNWMSNDMTGSGQPAPTASTGGYSMPSSEMPGMQTVGDNRLRLEVDLQNVTKQVQKYALNDFHVLGPNGHTYGLAGYGRSDSVTSGVLEPRFQVTVDLYFDIPSQQSHNLSIVWSRGGDTVKFPVNTSGKPSPHQH